MSYDTADVLVIFGATGDLAKLETFPALVGLVERGVLDAPVIDVSEAPSDSALPRLGRVARELSGTLPAGHPRC